MQCQESGLLLQLWGRRASLRCVLPFKAPHLQVLRREFTSQVLPAVGKTGAYFSPLLLPKWVHDQEMCFYAQESNVSGQPIFRDPVQIWAVFQELFSLLSPTNSAGQRCAFRASGLQIPPLALQLPHFPSDQTLVISGSWDNSLICEQWLFLSGPFIFFYPPHTWETRADCLYSSSLGISLHTSCAALPHGSKSTATAGKLLPWWPWLGRQLEAEMWREQEQ